ncbi:fumarylacetoacetase [uncultured Roseobacter sp.]|uniref:fumarylacetoacetase n=1 Tax=uncultured Roseobacter sp. TaxID=114847 RepID=UPI00262D4B96|nr:fumarylacetoacetase [uncultured Roseobacter sp.]
MPLMRSWVASANDAGCDFPLNNLPYGVFSTDPQDARCGVAIGDQVLDLAAVEAAGLIALSDAPVFDLPYWNDVMDLGPEAWAALRALLKDMLKEASPDQAQLAPFLVPLSEVRLHLPFVVSEFTDFYASRHHATNVGTMFRGAENALPPNWLHMPIGYNGRASTVVISGTQVRRPCGQIKPPEADAPRFAPTEKLDIELELGAVVGVSSPMGTRLSVAEAEAMIFGYVLLNDWSARDIQAWEYQPLGPFQAKAFATSISPWIVTAEALAPFRAAAPDPDVPLLPHLQAPGPLLYDIDLSVLMAPEGGAAEVIARTNYAELTYGAAQQLAHHATSGCAMNAGDLLGSGTISGAAPDARGSLLELTWNGTEPLTLKDGTERRFVEDGDMLTLTGHAAGDGYRVGFGACAGQILPALEP